MPQSSENLDKTSLTSEYPIDQVLASYSRSRPTSGFPVAYIFGQDIAEAGGINPKNCLWVSRFSIDNNNWVSVPGVILVGSNYISLGAYLDSSANFHMSLSNTTGVTYTIYFETTLIARSNQIPWKQPTNFFGSGVDLVYANRKVPLFDSRLNYIKIAGQGITSATISNDGSFTFITIPHGLEFVPFAFIQFEYNGQIFNPSNTTETVGMLPVPSFTYIYVDSGNIYIQTGGVISDNPYNINIHWKVYWDH